MAYLPQALAHAHPKRPARLGPVPVLTVLVTVLALVLVALPLSSPAEAKRPHKTHRAAKAKPKAVPRVAGQPPRNYVIPPTSFFSYPNRGKADRMAIRDRVLRTIQSVWGGRRTAIGTPLPGNGTIRIATWSFDDWTVARALVAARKRGVSVQVVAAKAANKDHASWKWLRERLGTRLYRPGYPSTQETVSFARHCRGACRGPGGTAHSKYFLFDNVGAQHARRVVVQTSMNLTTMAFSGQWNQAQVQHSYRIHSDFLSVFRQTRLTRGYLRPYHVKNFGTIVNYFYPRPRATPAQDLVMQNLNAVNCRGATTGGGSGRTMIRVIQYAIYGDRGVWITKKLRYLWDAGCDVAIIYAVASRPVLDILRAKSGRGPIPIRQSVITDPWGNIVKYNHSKWMTITGNWNRQPASYVTLSGSANWADLAFGDDEQTQRISSRTESLRHLAAFKRTWRQKSSLRYSAGRVVRFGRAAVTPPPEEGEPIFGQGIYRYLPAD